MRRRPSLPPPPSGRSPPGPPFPPRPPTLEDARQWSTASARSEAEPRTRTAARPLTSAAMRCRPSRPPPPPGRRPPVFPLHSIFVASAMRRARQTGPGPSRGSTSPAGAGRAQAPARRETRTADTLQVVHASLAPIQRRRTLWLRSCRRTTASWWRTTASWWTTASWLRTKASWWRADGLHQLAVFLIPPPCSPTLPPSPAAPRGCRIRSPECSRDDVAVSLHRHTVRRAEARPASRSDLPERANGDTIVAVKANAFTIDSVAVKANGDIVSRAFW
jgi:hypothetical protein